MLSLSLPLEQMVLFFFVFVRVAAILFAVPFLEPRNIPILIKVGLAVSVTWILLPQIDLAPPSVESSPVAFALGIASEVAIGLIIGIMVKLLFAGVQLAGQMAGFQMGFAIANVVDPASSMQIPMLSQFFNLFAFMIFLSLNIHYYFIKALVDGFEILPFWSAQFDGDLYQLIMATTANAFKIAVQLGAPVMVALLLTSVALGLTARTVPQMQIFIVAMPVKIILGLLFLGFSLPYCMTFLKSAFMTLSRNVQGLMHLLM
ncbi:MAG: flagellar biosynthetic protein FliR [Desulfobacteraceae bacterium]|jgi:flagellar biosynthetic protein FliR